MKLVTFEELKERQSWEHIVNMGSKEWHKHGEVSRAGPPVFHQYNKITYNFIPIMLTSPTAYLSVLLLSSHFVLSLQKC